MMKTICTDIFCPQMAEAEAGREACGATGGSRVLSQINTRGAACATHARPALHCQ